MTAPNPSFDSPSILAARRGDALCDAFEKEWKRVEAGGPRPDLARALQLAPVDASGLARELVALDVYYRRRLGERPIAADYAALAIELDPAWFAAQDSSPAKAATVRIGQDGTDDQNGQSSTASVAGLPAVFGHYELLEEIARGGMGVIYRARHKVLQRTVALKMILAGRLASRAEVERFRTEAEAAAQLEHPNIVPIYEVGEFEGRHYFTMRLIDGRSLNLAAARFFGAPQAAARLLATIADAVQHAHSKAILHRDLKPANVLLEGAADGPLDQFVPYVTDFGLAKLLSENAGQTRSSVVLGTPAYMSPEQAAGQLRQISTATDVYGLGAILYELLTGRPPFVQPSIAGLLASVQHDEPIAPRSVNREIPADLETICLKCLQKAPESRYPSAAELSSDLQRFLRGEPIQARRVPPWERAIKWARRQPVVAALLLLLLVVSGSGAGVVAWKWRDAEHERTIANRRAVSEHAANQRAQRALSDLRVGNYYQQIARADLEFYSSDVIGAEQTLDQCEPDLRGWEWRYLKGLCQSSLWSFKSVGDVACALAFSPDGRQLAVASCNFNSNSISGRVSKTSRPSAIQLIELPSGKVLRTITGNLEQIRDMHFDPTGALLYTCAGNYEARQTGEIKVWNLVDGKLAWAPEGARGIIWRMALSNDGKLLAFTHGNSVELWDTAARVRLRTIPCAEPTFSIALRPDGLQLAVGLNSEIQIFESESGEQITSLTKIPGKSVRALAWHPNGKMLGAGTFTGSAFLVDLGDQSVKALSDQQNSLTRVIFLVKGNTVAFGCGDGLVRMFDLRTGAATVLQGHTREVYAVVCSPGGHLFASGSADGIVKVWDPLNWRRHVPSRGRIQALACTTDGKFALSASELPASRSEPSPLTVWNLATGLPVRNLTRRVGGMLCVAVGPDDLLAHDWNHEIKLWRREKSSWIEWQTLSGHSDRVNAISFRPHHREFASAGNDKAVHIWRADAAEEGDQFSLHRALTGHHESPVLCAIYSHDNQRLATADAGGVLCLWDANSGQLLQSRPAHQGPILALAFHPNGNELASAGDDGVILTWSVSDGTRRREFRGHTSTVSGLDFTSDGTRLVSAGSDDDVRLWDPVTGQTVLTFRQQVKAPKDITFSPDGDRLIAGSGSTNLITVWDASDPRKSHAERIRDWHLSELRHADSKNQHATIVSHLNALLLQPGSHPNWPTNRAWHLAELGNWEEAARQTSTEIPLSVLDGSLTGAGFRRCWLRTAFGTPAEVQQICELVLARYRQPDNGAASYHAGVICAYRIWKISAPEQLVAMTRRGVELEPENARNWEVLAAAQLRAGKFTDAIASIEQVRKLAPTGHGVDSFIQAIAHAKLDETTKAIACYEQGAAWVDQNYDVRPTFQTRYFDLLLLQREAARALNLPEPDLTPWSPGKHSPSDVASQ